MKRIIININNTNNTNNIIYIVNKLYKQKFNIK